MKRKTFQERIVNNLPKFAKIKCYRKYHSFTMRIFANILFRSLYVNSETGTVTDALSGESEMRAGSKL